MDIFIGRNGSVIGPYEEDEILRRLDDDRLDGTELAWHEGLDEWVKVKELLEDKAPVPEAEETSMETESAEEPEPLDEETILQVNKIKELIVLGHVDTTWQLIQSLNNPRIYEGLLEDCPVYDNGWVHAPEYLSENGDLFIKFLINLPESAWLKPGLRQLTKLDLTSSTLADVSALAGLTQLTSLLLCLNQNTDVSALKELTQLKRLTLTDNQITDISVLKELTQLTELDLSSPRPPGLKDVKGLEGLTNLKLLDLSDNQIVDVTPLKDLTQLTQLQLSDNRISDVGALAGLRQLTLLDLRENIITDVAPLAELTKLEWLCLGEDRELELQKCHIHSNMITNLQPLTGLENLRGLTLYRNLDLSQSEVDMLAAALPQCSIGYRSVSEQREEDDEWWEEITKWANYEGPGSGPGSWED